MFCGPPPGEVRGSTYHQYDTYLVAAVVVVVVVI